MWDEPEPELSHGTVIRYNIGYKQVSLAKQSPYIHEITHNIYIAYMFKWLEEKIKMYPLTVWSKEPAPVL